MKKASKTGRYSRNKGKRGELDLVHRIPGAKRVGISFKKSIVDIEWPRGVAQVKNHSRIGGTTIAELLDELSRVSDKRVYVIFKGKRGRWIVCQTLDQFLGGGDGV